MKIKDYRRLGKISIKSRKKSTKHTVTGICFGLIMLIPIVFFTLSFYIGLTGELDKTATTSVFAINSRNVYDEGAQIIDDSDWGGELAMFDYRTGQRLADNPLVEQYVASEFYRLAGAQSNSGSGNSLKMTVDGKPYTFRSSTGMDGRQSVPNTFKIVNNYLGDTCFLDAEKKDLNSRNVRLFTAGDGFTDDGKGQIVVSEQFLTAFGVSFQDMQTLVGKTLSLSASVSKQQGISGGSMYLLDADDSISDDLYNQTATLDFLSDFTVVGILSDDYYKLPSNVYEAHVIITAASVYTEDYRAVAPVTQLNIEENEYGGRDVRMTVRYGDGISAMCARAKGEGRAVLALGALVPQQSRYGSMQDIYYYDMTDTANITQPLLLFKMQCHDYAAASKFAKTLNSAYSVIMPASAQSPVGAVSQFANEVYNNFFMLSTIGKYVMLILYSFGGIIFFATMLNLYNSVNYSVQARRNYMGVMRAIGAKQKMIPRLYFFEILLIFGRALPWVLVFSAGISYGIKAGVDALFRYIGETLGGIIRLSFSWYFVTLAGVFVLVFAIALAFSQIACKNVAGKPILDVLSDDKG